MTRKLSNTLEAIRSREWRKKHPNKSREASRKWRKNHGKEYQAKYYQEHKEEWKKRAQNLSQEQKAERVRLGKILRHKKKKFIVDALGGKCQNPKCSTPGGYDRNWQALDIHHNIPTEKEVRVGKLVQYSWVIIKQELKKDIRLLCSNCHRELHSTLEDEEDIH